MENDVNKKQLLEFFSALTNIPPNELDNMGKAFKITLEKAPNMPEEGQAYTDGLSVLKKILKDASQQSYSEKVKNMKQENYDAHKTPEQPVPFINMAFNPVTLKQYMVSLNILPKEYLNRMDCKILDEMMQSIMKNANKLIDSQMKEAVQKKVAEFVAEDKAKEPKLVSLGASKMNALKALIDRKAVTNVEFKKTGYFFMNADGNILFHADNEDVNTTVDLNTIDSKEWFILVSK